MRLIRTHQLLHTVLRHPQQKICSLALRLLPFNLHQLSERVAFSPQRPSNRGNVNIDVDLPQRVLCLDDCDRWILGGKPRDMIDDGPLQLPTSALPACIERIRPCFAKPFLGSVYRTGTDPSKCLQPATAPRVSLRLWRHRNYIAISCSAGGTCDLATRRRTSLRLRPCAYQDVLSDCPSC